MAWTVRVGTPVSGLANITPGAPTGHAANDIDLLITESDNGTTFALTTANGFAAVTGGQAVVGTGPSASSTTMTVYWRRWNGTDGNPTITDTGNHTFSVMLSFAGGITSGNPWDQVITSTEATADTSGSATGGTATVAGSIVVVCVANALPDAAAIPATNFSAWTNADLTNLTEQVDATTADGNGGGLGVATGELAGATAFAATTYTAGASTAKAHVVLNLKPAVAAAASLLIPPRRVYRGR